MATTMKQAQSASHAWLEAGALEALREARHGDPFAVLGLHRVGEGDSAGWALRCFLPRTEGVEVLDLDGQVLGAMERQPESDLFVAFWSGAGEPFAYRLKVTWDGGHQTQLADPYSFGPLMPEMDVWLMAQGEHQRPYEWLGAHVLDMGGVGGVRFSVWAPNARRVSVVGDFNQWDGRRHPMRLRRECGVWELFIPGVQEGDLYQFELLGADGHLRRKADPFAFKAQMRPERASVVQRLLPGLASDDKRRAANALDAPLSIYEVHLGSWRRHADGTWLTYRDMAEHLVPYAAWMGFTHIELLPVHEFPFDGSWGYQPTGLYAPTSRFGTPEDLRALIDAAHHAGLGVILDWVPGHFPSDEHGLAQFDGTHLFEHADPREGYHQDWNTLIYNYGRAEVRNFLTGNALYWIERFGVDGLRVDAVASMLYRDYSRKHGEWIPNRHGGRENLEAIDFLRRMNRLVGTLRPEAITLAEESTSFPAVSRPPSDDLQSGGLGFHYKWNMGWMNDTLAYFSKDPVYRQHHHDQIRFSLMYAFSENFVLPLSHDEVVHGKGSLLRKMPGDEWQRFANLRALYGWMWGHPGKKLLFMGCEFAQADEWNADRSLDWHLTHHPLHGGVQRLVRRLNQTLRGLTALHEQDADPAGFSWVSHEDAAHSMLAFLRRDRWGRSALVVSNLTPVVRHGWRVGVPCGGIWHTWVNTDDAEFGGSGVVQASVEASPVEWQGHAQSIVLTLPPLATLILSPDVPGEPS